MEEFELEEGERVTLTVRKHWFVLLLSMLPFLLLAYLPTVLPGLFAGFAKQSPELLELLSTLTLDNMYVRLFLGLWWLMLWIGAFNTFTQYYLNHWVITSHRIVRIEQHGFFNREVSSFLLLKVQDVSTTVDGIFADLLGYGTIQVETAGTSAKHFVMDGVSDPQGMRDLIMREIGQLHTPTNTGV
ncbi:MAG: hypothetical protein AB199_03720 [Parcubacteria bacterium C7867-004]|nr:MAG: hypothetical protein AB199_03720 [Parcubacteria bacterium C7867-004]